MSISIDMSKGIDPVRAWYDAKEQMYQFYVDGTRYQLKGPHLPFTLIDDTKLGRAADRELVLKHGKKNG